MTRFLLLLLLAFPASESAQAQRNASSAEVIELPEEAKSKTEFLNPQYLLVTPDLKNSKKALPLVIYLHGAGGVGDQIKRIEPQPRRVLKSIQEHGHSPCLMVAPQCLKQSKKGERGIWTPGDLQIFLAHLKATLPIDEKQIYLTGNSMGGYGTWVWAATHPENFAAVAPMVGGIGRGGPKDVTKDLDQWTTNLLKVPVWAFAGGQDKVVPAEYSERVIKGTVAKGHKNAKVTVYPDEGHNAGRLAYEDPKFWEWLFSQKRS